MSKRVRVSVRERERERGREGERESSSCSVFVLEVCSCRSSKNDMADTTKPEAAAAVAAASETDAEKAKRLKEEAKARKLAKKMAKKQKGRAAASGPAPPNVNTATLIVKAAAMRVFGVPGSRTTSGVRCFPGNRKFVLTLTLPFLDFATLEKITASRVWELQAAISKLIEANVCVCTFAMNRVEAEAKYGERIYHGVQERPTTEEVNVVVIHDTAAFYTPLERKDFVPSTGGVGTVNLTLKPVKDKSGAVVDQVPKIVCKGLKGKNEVIISVDISEAPPAERVPAPVYRCSGPPSAQDVEFMDTATVEEATSKETKPANDGADATSPEGEGDFVVDPWTVEGVVDYSKLIDRFGSTAIDDVSIGIEKWALDAAAVQAQDA